MEFFRQILAALPAVATSWQAVIGYVAVVIAFVIVSLKVTRNKNLLNRLQKLPEQDRARALEMEMGAPYLEGGLSPAQWLEQQRQRYYFLAFLAVCALVLALVIAATFNRGPTDDEPAKQTAARTLAERFVKLVHARDFDKAYDMLPEQVRQNVSFAQFRADMERTIFQMPDKPLRDETKQTVPTGGFLAFLILTEFSVNTRLHNVVTFTRAGSDWTLFRYDWQPVEWPLAWPSSTEIRQTAGEAMKAFLALGPGKASGTLPEEFRGDITGSTPGWKLTVESVSAPEDQYRCGVMTRETDSSTSVELKHVLGGCKLKPGQQIVVHALIASIDSSHIGVEGVRYYP